MSEDPSNPVSRGLLQEHAAVPDERSLSTGELIPPQTSTAPAAGWSMPAPKFQRTSGYLPQGYLKRAENVETPVTPAAKPNPSDPGELNGHADGSPAANEHTAIEPQPDLVEILDDEGSVELPEVADTADRGRTARGPWLILLFLAGGLAFAGVFLAAVYYLFLRAG